MELNFYPILGFGHLLYTGAVSRIQFIRVGNGDDILFYLHEMCKIGESKFSILRHNLVLGNIQPLTAIIHQLL